MQFYFDSTILEFSNAREKEDYGKEKVLDLWPLSPCNISIQKKFFSKCFDEAKNFSKNTLMIIQEYIARCEY